MHGSGSVHGLREAMSLGTTQATTLTNTVTQFAAATTRDAQMALLDQLVQQWGATSALTTSNPFVPGAPDEFTLANPSDPMGQKIQTFARANPTLYRKIIALEQFNGQTGLTQLISRWGTSLPSGVTSSLESAYTALRESTYGALALQTRLKPYFDAVTLTVSDSGVGFDTSGLDNLLATNKATNEHDALLDLIDLKKFANSSTKAIGYDALGKLTGWLDSIAVDSPIYDSNWQAVNSTSAGNDLYMGSRTTDSLSLGAGNDFAWGGAGNDTIDGGNGDDTLLGGDGNDTITDFYNYNTIYGGQGDDTITTRGIVE
ncbi:MAG: hypothetical protein HY836_18000, partial [Aquabacterium sp.]|nr:hypothetical protein [Aquabacterium sp.]